MNDLVFYGGKIGAFLGNQQFTVRNLTFYNTVTAIDQIWDWGWTYQVRDLAPTGSFFLIVDRA